MKRIILFIFILPFFIGCSEQVEEEPSCCATPPIVIDNHFYFTDANNNDLLEGIDIVHLKYNGTYILEDKDVLSPSIYKLKQKINQQELEENAEIICKTDQEGRRYLKFNALFLLRKEDEGEQILSYSFSCPYLFGTDEYQEIRIKATYYNNSFKQTNIFLNEEEGVCFDWEEAYIKGIIYKSEFILSE